MNVLDSLAVVFMIKSAYLALFLSRTTVKTSVRAYKVTKQINFACAIFDSFPAARQPDSYFDLFYKRCVYKKSRQVDLLKFHDM